ncbi:Plasmid stabilization system protein [Luteitalea pratensis]|uniref:Plasmid stabilization system protein n=1 Tax=Luteitalea pratensis TaxID=1855912 RepID=A0A143PMW5_LUTPR|nr:type II toxin-antitoxin system RelE/ParE family toxin [Luteitalea pratensis]AMY09109.1 Plasmid stabilization system protein [Luteitalea pratensis]
MSAKPLVLRALAIRDVDEAVACYVGAGGESAALGFIDALEMALSRISRHPGSGSPRHAHELNLPGLRCATVRRHPHLVFYVEVEAHVDVWRVLHGERDIPAWLMSPDTA